MNEDDSEAIRASLVPVIAKARDGHKWLWCYYQDLWFSPDELEKANAAGKFLWGPINWKTRDPRERQVELDRRAAEAVNAARTFRLKWQGP